MKYVAAAQRLQTIGGPLLIRNASLCPRRTQTPGFIVHSDFDVPDALRDVAYERLLLGSDARVMAVYPGTEAWEKGVRPGDVLLTMDDKRIRNAADARARLRRSNRDKEQHAHFGFIRDGRSFSVHLPFTPMCKYPLLYWEGKRDINAFATGRAIIVTQGMMDFTNDRELGAVIGHELAHNIMHHIPKDKVNTVPLRVAGLLIDGLSGLVWGDGKTSDRLVALYTHIWSKKFETEADYVGLYLLARGGGDISAAAPFWRKMAAEHGISAVRLPEGALRTHPDSPARFAVLEKTEKEINDKIRMNEPLMPNLERDFSFGRKYWPWENPDDSREEPDDQDLNH